MFAVDHYPIPHPLRFPLFAQFTIQAPIGIYQKMDELSCKSSSGLAIQGENPYLPPFTFANYPLEESMESDTIVR